MAKAKARKKARNLGGRPPLPPEQRASRRISVRLYAEDDELLGNLCKQLDLSETEVIRRAIALFGRQHNIKRA
jgi:hypothetical protein